MANGGYIGMYRGLEVYVIDMERFFGMKEDTRNLNDAIWVVAEDGNMFYQGGFFGKLSPDRCSVSEASPGLKNYHWKNFYDNRYDDWVREKTEPKARVAEPAIISQRSTVESVATGAERLEILAGSGKEALDRIAGYAAGRLSQLMAEAAAHRR